SSNLLPGAIPSAKQTRAPPLHTSPRPGCTQKEALRCPCTPRCGTSSPRPRGPRNLPFHHWRQFPCASPAARTSLETAEPPPPPATAAPYDHVVESDPSPQSHKSSRRGL